MGRNAAHNAAPEGRCRGQLKPAPYSGRSRRAGSEAGLPVLVEGPHARTQTERCYRPKMAPSARPPSQGSDSSEPRACAHDTGSGTSAVQSPDFTSQGAMSIGDTSGSAPGSAAGPGTSERSVAQPDTGTVNADAVGTGPVDSTASSRKAGLATLAGSEGGPSSPRSSPNTSDAQEDASAPHRSAPLPESSTSTPRGGNGSSPLDEKTAGGKIDANPPFAPSEPSSFSTGASQNKDQEEPATLGSRDVGRRRPTPDTSEWKAALALAKQKLASSRPPPAPSDPKQSPEPVRRHAYGDTGDWRNVLQAAKQKLGTASSVEAPSKQPDENVTAPASSDSLDPQALEADAASSIPPPPPQSAERPSSIPLRPAPASSDDEWRAAIEMARRIHSSSSPVPPPPKDTEEAPEAAPAPESPGAPGVPAEWAAASATEAPSAGEKAPTEVVEPQEIRATETQLSVEAAVPADEAVNPQASETMVAGARPAETHPVAEADPVFPAQPAAEAEQPDQAAAEAVQPVAAKTATDGVEERPGEPPLATAAAAPKASEAPVVAAPPGSAPTATEESKLSAEPNDKLANEAPSARTALDTAERALSAATEEPAAPSDEDDKDEWAAALEAAKRQHESTPPEPPAELPPRDAGAIAAPGAPPQQAAMDTVAQTSEEEDEWLAAIEAARRLHDDQPESNAPPLPAAVPAAAANAIALAPSAVSGGLQAQTETGQAPQASTSASQPIETAAGEVAASDASTAESTSASDDEDDWLAAIAAAKARDEQPAPDAQNAEAPPAAREPEPQSAPTVAVPSSATAAQDDEVDDEAWTRAAAEPEATVEARRPSAEAPMQQMRPGLEEPTLVAHPGALRLLTDAELDARKTHSEQAPIAQGAAQQVATGSAQSEAGGKAAPAALTPLAGVTAVSPPTESRSQNTPQAVSADFEPEVPTVAAPPASTASPAPTAEQKEQWRAAFESVRQRLSGNAPSPFAPRQSGESSSVGAAGSEASAAAASAIEASTVSAETATSESVSASTAKTTEAANAARALTEEDVTAVVQEAVTAPALAAQAPASAPVVAASTEPIANPLIQVAAPELFAEPNQDDRPTPTVPPLAYNESVEVPSSVRAAQHTQKRAEPGENVQPPRAETPTLVGMPTPSLEQQTRPWTQTEPTGTLVRITSLRATIAAAVILGAFALGALARGSTQSAKDTPPIAHHATDRDVPEEPPPRAPARRSAEAAVEALEPAALERLKLLPQGERTAAQAAALGRHWLRQRQEEFGRFGERLKKNPALLDEAETRQKVLDYVNDRATSVGALELLVSLGTPRALDIVYEIWTGPKDRTDTTRLAEALLQAKDVRPRWSPPLALAMALREKPTSCETVRELVKQAIAHGDRRSAMLLVKTGGRRDCSDGQEQKECGKCPEDPKQLRDAIRMAAGREGPTL